MTEKKKTERALSFYRLLILALMLSACAPLPQRDPYTAAMQREQSLRLMQIGAQLMINSGPRPIYAPTLNTPQNVTCTQFAYGITNCRQW